MKNLRWWCVIVLLACTAIPIQSARANILKVEYTFFDQAGHNDIEAAQFIVPTFITSNTTIPANQLESCVVTGLTCSLVGLEVGVLVASQNRDVLRIDTVENLTGVGFAFPLGSFETVGLYFDVSGTAVLSVKQVSVPEPTPLPSSWTMLIAGLLGLGFIAYRGTRNATPVVAVG